MTEVNEIGHQVSRHSSQQPLHFRQGVLTCDQGAVEMLRGDYSGVPAGCAGQTEAVDAFREVHGKGCCRGLGEK